MRKYLVRGGNTYPKARSSPNGGQQLLFRKKLYGVYVFMYLCMYIISVVVLQIYIYQSCAHIDNYQQVYEVQIQVPKCNSIMDEKIFGKGWNYLSKCKIFRKWWTTYRHYVRWVALRLWSVCSPVHRSRWSGLSYWHSCEPAFKILLHFV
jgi:hypothetical protein